MDAAVQPLDGLGPSRSAGQFKFTTLPPGAYLAIAVEYVAQGEWIDPEWLERAARKATRFTLDEGAAKTPRLLKTRPAR